MPRIQVALGVAPEHADSYDDALEQVIREALPNKHVVAIGSCGLSETAGAGEVAAFERQIRLAKSFGMPLIVQARGAEALDCALDMVKRGGMAPERVMMRIGAADPAWVQSWVSWGCYLSFDGNTTDDPIGYCKLAEEVPSDRVLVESGSPDVALAALCGYDPRPDQVVFVADTLASRVTTSQIVENARAFFA